MKLRITTVLFFAFVFFLSACKGPCVKGSGNVIINNRLLTHFNELELSGAYTVELTQDSMQKVEVIADDNIQEYIKTTVSGDRLSVYNDKNFCINDKVIVKIHLKELTNVEVSGAVDVKMMNQFTVDHLNFKSSGATNSILNVNTKSIDAKISGAGKIEFKGQTADCNIAISGAAKIRAFSLITNKCTIDISGAGDTEVNVLSELNVSASGASKVRYKGNPAKINKQAQGASSVEKAE
ncbi:head GIN domain-containing protein [Solitalea lacus]|uniref:head GIN domain-containing protein n=1 Tax=Solitalea lacus TaxID=2911172 RepID=UPI001ED9D323|nr:head GIN domain-containing protein [Solitalea lacus]UKJ05837.1 DUF2807 domain-containing protein [Solitalea lacus]